MPARKLSGLQKDVLALYRSILREAIRKDNKILPSAPRVVSSGTAESHHIPVSQLLSSPSSTAYARNQFRKEASLVRRSDFKTIEYKIRKGKKQLQLLKMPGVDLVGSGSSGI